MEQFSTGPVGIMRTIHLIWTAKFHCSSCHTASPKANETNLCAIYPVVTQRWWTYLPSLSFGELSLSQQLLSVWAVPAPKYNRVFLTASPGDWLAVKNSPWLIWSSAGTGFIKPGPPCLQAVLWHSKEGVSFTDKTFMERQRWGLPCCPPSADPCLRVDGERHYVTLFQRPHCM